MVTTKKLMTAEELAQLPDDDMRYELAEGELITMAPASPHHGVVAGRIQKKLNLFDPDGRLGEVVSADTGYKLADNPDTVRAPDLAFISANKIKTVVAQYPFSTVPPDLPIEVLSPSNSASDVWRKVQEYLRAGSRMVWIVDPATLSVTVWRPDETATVLHEDDEIDGADVLPGFKCRVGEFFPEP